MLDILICLLVDRHDACAMAVLSLGVGNFSLGVHDCLARTARESANKEVGLSIVVHICSGTRAYARLAWTAWYAVWRYGHFFPSALHIGN